MQVQQEQVDSRLNSTAYIRERGMVDLQEAVSRYLPPLYKGLIATSAIHTTQKTRCKMLSCPLSNTWINSREAHR